MPAFAGMTKSLDRNLLPQRRQRPVTSENHVASEKTFGKTGFVLDWRFSKRAADSCGRIGAPRAQELLTRETRDCRRGEPVERKGRRTLALDFSIAQSGDGANGSGGVFLFPTAQRIEKARLVEIKGNKRK
jgi:hypothetical protein